MTAGRQGNADILGLNVNEAGQYRFFYESWGIGMWPSAPMASPKDHMVSLRVRLGSTLGLKPRSPLGILARSVVIWEDGAPVWWHRTASPFPEDPAVCLFSNSLGSSTLEPVFRGGLISASRTPLAIAWRDGPFLGVELQLGGCGSGCEPLAATGAPGHSDALGIEWLDKGAARLVYDHAGQRLRASKAFEWRDTALNGVRVDMPSFRTLDKPGFAGGESRLRAWVGGEAVWDAKVPYFGAPSESVSLGRNDSASASMGADLTPVVVDIRQLAGE